jgi:hypothetical protein
MALNNGSRHGADLQRPQRARRKQTVLDQAIAINGDLRVQLLGMSLLPIKVRLLISSKDVAAELGLDWWRSQGRDRKRSRTGSSRPHR